jgi:hypothetical protein
MKTTDQRDPKKIRSSIPHSATNPTDSCAVLPTQVFSAPQPSAISDEQLEKVNKELQFLAAATQLQP